MNATRALSCTAGLAVSFAIALTSCTSNCSTWVVTVFVEDQGTGKLLCDAQVSFGVGDAGVPLDASVPPTDAEASSSPSGCQWDVVVGGGNYQVTATAPGFKPGTATLNLPPDECGSATAPVTVILVR